jgi:pSer/pThr/pTyr-binding forkhead associated (FHA) protein
MKLLAQSGSLSGQEWPVGSDKPVIVLGRGASSDIVLPDQQSSRHHAEIRFSEGQVSITDGGSMNGTFVNDVRITGTQTLFPGDKVRIGDAQFVLQQGTATTQKAIARGMAEPPPPVERGGKSGLGLILGGIVVLVLVIAAAVVAFLFLRGKITSQAVTDATGTPISAVAATMAAKPTPVPTQSTPVPSSGPTGTPLVEAFVTLTSQPVVATSTGASAAGGTPQSPLAKTPQAVPFRVTWSPGRYEGWADGRRMSSDLTIQNISLPQITPPYAPYFIISDPKGNMRAGELKDYSSGANRQPALGPGQQVMWTWFAIMTNQEWVRGSVFRYGGYAWAQEFNPDGSLNGAPRVIDEKQFIPFLPKQVPPEMLATMAAGGSMPTGVPTGIPTGVPTGVPTAKP